MCSSFSGLARAAQFIGAEIELKLVPESDEVCRNCPTRCHHCTVPRRREQHSTSNHGFCFIPMFFCELRSFMTIQTFFTPPLLEKTAG